MALDAALDSGQRDIARLSEDLFEGRITLAAWQQRMAQIIKDQNLAAMALAKGGWKSLSPADYGRVGLRIREQYKFLRRFALQIERGLPLDGRFRARAKMYGQAGRKTYHMVQRAEMIARGMTEESNVLNPAADHCPGCVGETARGWVPIGELVLVGSRDCFAHCRCTVDYR